jgi:hypothetical protein
MGIWEWLSQNWFNLFGSAGIAGLWLTAVMLRSETKARRNANLLAITVNHREIWLAYLNNSKLERVLDSTANLDKQPVTETERVFVNLVMLHAASVYHATSSQMTVKLDGLRRDIAHFLSLPIPCVVWDKIKFLQNDDFVAFVASCQNLK